MDIQEIKKGIILKEGTYYFDYAASGLGYQPIENEINALLKTYANTHSNSNDHAIKTSEYYQGAKKGIKNLLKLEDKFYTIACGSGSTAAIKKFQELMGIYIPPMTREFLGIDKSKIANLPLVIISPFEHHSNELSYRGGLCEVVRIGLDENGRMDFDELDRALKANKGRKIIASFCLTSNVTGVVMDYQRAYFMIKGSGGIVAFDASSYLPYADINPMFYDALFFSGHKFLGGVSSPGMLVIKKELCKGDEPTFAGGGTVQYASRSETIYSVDTEELEEAGTPPILGVVKLYLALKLRNDAGLEVIKQRENMLKEYFYNKISKINEIRLYGGDLKDRMAIFSFDIKGFDSHKFAGILSQKYGVMCRAGCLCAGPYGHDLLGLDDHQAIENKPNFVRISLHYTHDEDDIDYLVSAIKYIVKIRDKIRLSQGRYQC